MPVRVTWIGKPPEDREAWEDILNAEYGNALGWARVELEPMGDGWQVRRVEEGSQAPGAQPRVDASRRFVTALRDAGKPVIAPSADKDGELEAVTTSALFDRAEDVRRHGGGNE